MLSKDEIIERLDDVFRDVFLIGAVEDEFKMRFKMGEVSGMKDVGEMIGIIEQRGK